MSEIGQRLREFIDSRKLSIEELSKSIEESRTRVTSVLRGKQRLPVDMLEKLIKVHGIDANWLITGQVTPAPQSIDRGAQLANAVRAGFILKGTTMADWCRENGIKHQHARSALIGGWNGPKGTQVREQLLRAAGVVGESK